MSVFASVGGGGFGKKRIKKICFLFFIKEERVEFKVKQKRQEKTHLRRKFICFFFSENLLSEEKRRERKWELDMI